MNQLERAIVQAGLPLASAVVAAERRLDLLESGTSRSAAEKSARDLLKMIDGFETGQMDVADLPHIKALISLRRAFGLPNNMPEVP